MLTHLDRLSFGRMIPDGSSVYPALWQDFERDEIASRFPAGYTVIHGEGAWKDASSGAVIHEPATIVEISHDGSPEVDAAIRAVAAVYKVLFKQDAVMRTTSKVDVDFL